MTIGTARGERRLTRRQYKLLLSAHILASVGWLGVVAAKAALLLAAGSAADATGLYAAVAVVDRVFPPAAILTLISGVLLGLGTTWGVFDYTWVVTKLALTVAVPMTAVRFGERLLQQAAADAAAQLLAAGGIGPAAGPASAGSMLLLVGFLHLLALAVATILSVYMPWGRTWIGRRKAPRSAPALAR